MGLILVNSWGGSASTFLADSLSEALSQHTVIHAHSTPLDFSGPLKSLRSNPYTGGVEGAFTGDQEIDPESTLIIVICRNPKHVYLSRNGFDHFCHIWAGSKTFNDVFNGRDEEDLRHIYDQRWIEYEQANNDILHLKEYYMSWKAYALKRYYNIAFIKYETFNVFADHLVMFAQKLLDSREEEWKKLVKLLSNFKPTPNRVSNSLPDIFNDIRWFEDDPQIMLWSRLSTL